MHFSSLLLTLHESLIFVLQSTSTSKVVVGEGKFHHFVGDGKLSKFHHFVGEGKLSKFHHFKTALSRRAKAKQKRCRSFAVSLQQARNLQSTFTSKVVVGEGKLSKFNHFVGEGKLSKVHHFKTPLSRRAKAKQKRCRSFAVSLEQARNLPA